MKKPVLRHTSDVKPYKKLNLGRKDRKNLYLCIQFSLFVEIIAFMVNRVLLRIKVIQIVYAYYRGEGNSIPKAEKELIYSIEKAYDLYFHLLQLALEVTDYAYNRIDQRRNRLRPSEEDLNPNLRFVENRFVKQLRDNLTLNEYLKERKLSWANNDDVVRLVYELMLETDFYSEYMSAAESDYNADKLLWRRIFRNIILLSSEFADSIEDQSIYWADDLDIVLSFVVKTIKQFKESNGVGQELLPMFRDEEDREFSLKLLRETLTNESEYRELIDKQTPHWDLDRIAFMDIVLMQAALAEITSFPTIPISVTLNEYIEMSKYYSTDRSATFINGVLDNIVKELEADNKLIKVVKI